MTEFEEIYRTYFNDVYLYILRLTGNEHIAEEITSDTFFKALHAIDRFRGDCDIRVWLCQIAKNCYYSYVKKSERIDSLEDIPPSAICGESPDEQLIAAEEAQRIRAILHEIPDPYKEVFMWRVYAELSFKQIGQLFHKSENWACVTYHRARGKIKERLEESDHEKNM